MEIKVYDHHGKKRNLAYLRGRYGDFAIQEPPEGEGPAFKVSALRERVNAEATLVVRVIDAAKEPIEGLRVAWYWPAAPEDAGAGPKGTLPRGVQPKRAVSGKTDRDGEIGFGMGLGAYYWPDREETGPYATWIHGPETHSDVVYGLGMVAATGHNHMDIEFTRVGGGTPPSAASPPSSTDEGTTTIEAELAKIEAAVQAIRDLLAT